MAAPELTMRHATPEPRKPLELTDATTIGQLCSELNNTLEDEGLMHLIGDTDGIHPFPTINVKRGASGIITADTPIRSLGARWLTCYAVPGANEGEYLHLVAVVQAPTLRTPRAPSALGALPELARELDKATRATHAPAALHLLLASGKTNAGMRGACEAAARISELLAAWEW